MNLLLGSQKVLCSEINNNKKLKEEEAKQVGGVETGRGYKREWVCITFILP